GRARGDVGFAPGLGLGCATRGGAAGGSKFVGTPSYAWRESDEPIQPLPRDGASLELTSHGTRADVVARIAVMGDCDRAGAMPPPTLARVRPNAGGMGRIDVAVRQGGPDGDQE